MRSPESTSAGVKDAEMLESEWNWLSEICGGIEGGDLESGVQFW